MKILKILLGILVVLVAVAFILSLVGPKDYRVERSQEINASAAAVYEQVAYFNNWSAWSSWAEMDPSAEYTVIGEDGKVGTKQSWKGDKSGEGSMEILEALPNEVVSHKLVFTAPWESEARTKFLIEALDSTHSKLTWIMTGKNETKMSRLMGAVMPMDKMIGKDFERGLFKLDSVLQANKEQTPTEITE